MKDNFITGFYMEKEFSSGQTVSFMTESLPIIESQAKVLTSGQMEVTTMEK